jgi:hypothetical protein
MALALIQVPHGLSCHLPEGFLEALLHHRDLERESCYLGNPKNYDAPRRQVKSIRKTALTNPAWKRIDSRKTLRRITPFNFSARPKILRKLARISLRWETLRDSSGLRVFVVDLGAGSTTKARRREESVVSFMLLVAARPHSRIRGRVVSLKPPMNR